VLTLAVNFYKPIRKKRIAMNHDVIFDSVEKGVCRIQLNRPQRMNALGVATVDALHKAIESAKNLKARVLLITGSERAFCAGADLKERKGMSLQERLAHNRAINDMVDAIGSSQFVTIAVLNGLALGGGLEMALACDLRLAAAGVNVGLTESRVGAFPGAGGTQRLPRLIGASRALHMMLQGEPVSSEYAFEIGLVNEVMPAEQLQTRAMQLAQLLAARSAPAQAHLKRLVYRGLEMSLDDGLKLERAALPSILGSADYAEGLNAFEERRAPQFTDALL
jgi:enoyl-CoA hydratase/carnithine racemase